LTLWESTQGVYNVQMQVAAALGMPFSMVRVVGHYMGGGFGSKLQAGKYSVLSALLAKMTAKPVKIVLSREETFLAVGNRPPANMRLKAGVKKDGTITALQFWGSELPVWTSSSATSTPAPTCAPSCRTSTSMLAPRGRSARRGTRRARGRWSR
jgi:xanthine dehydrogenase molybdopterin-binding subunit B